MDLRALLPKWDEFLRTLLPITKCILQDLHPNTQTRRQFNQPFVELPNACLNSKEQASTCKWTSGTFHIG